MDLVLILLAGAVAALLANVLIFLSALAARLPVSEFGLGMGPRVGGGRVGETTLTLKLLPVGGFVKIADEPGAPEGSRLQAAPGGARLLMVAGPSLVLLATAYALAAALPGQRLAGLVAVICGWMGISSLLPLPGMNGWHLVSRRDPAADPDAPVAPPWLMVTGILVTFLGTVSLFALLVARTDRVLAWLWSAV